MSKAALHCQSSEKKGRELRPMIAVKLDRFLLLSIGAKIERFLKIR